jgi:hypothetical protein
MAAALTWLLYWSIATNMRSAQFLLERNASRCLVVRRKLEARDVVLRAGVVVRFGDGEAGL